MQVIQVQLTAGEIVSAVLHVLDMDAEDLRARAMHDKNPVCSFLFSQSGALLSANAAAMQSINSQGASAECKPVVLTMT